MAIKKFQPETRVPLSADARMSYVLTTDVEAQDLGKETLARIRRGELEAKEIHGLSPTISVVTVRPLSPPEKDGAQEEGGPTPQLGFLVASYVEEEADKVEGARAKAVARARAVDALPKEERDAYESITTWQGGVLMAHARAGLVEVFLGELREDGRPVVYEGDQAWEAVMGIEDQRGKVIAEIGGHVIRLTALTEAGKA